MGNDDDLSRGKPVTESQEHCIKERQRVLSERHDAHSAAPYRYPISPSPPRTTGKIRRPGRYGTTTATCNFMSYEGFMDSGKPDPPPAPPESALQDRLLMSHTSHTKYRHVTVTENRVDPERSMTLPHVVKEFEASSPVFSSMTVDDALNYLSVHKECGFLHVVSKRDLYEFSRSALYDIVVLERPGFPESELVWSKTNKHESKSFRQKLMQLSLEGLLYTDEDNISVHISLKEFLHERNIVDALRRMKFFRLFYECKIMVHWKDWIRKVRFHRHKKKLNQCALFSDVPILKTVLKLRSVSYSLEAGLDLFAYRAPGSVNIMSYIKSQVEKVNNAADCVRRIVTDISDDIQNAFDTLVSYEYLKNRVDDIIAHHPYSKGEHADGDGVDWSQVRGVQRLRQEYQNKIMRVLVIGQYMVDAAMVEVMKSFWTRVSQQICGVRPVSVSKFSPGHVYIKDSGSEFGVWNLQSAVCLSTHHDFAESGRKVPAVDDGRLGRTQKPTLIKLPSVVDVDSPLLSSESLSGQMGSEFVSSVWQSAGSFFSVDIALVHSVDDVCQPVTIDMNNNTWSLASVKVQPLPTKQRMVQGLHELYGALGKLLDDIPNLRDHKLVTRGVLIKTKVDLSVDEAEKLELSNSTSSRYFSNLKSSSILSSSELFGIAVRCMHQMRGAYFQTIDMDATIQCLSSTFRRVWSLNTENLCKQLDRSMIVVKLKHVIEDDQHLPDETQIAIARDRARLSALTRSIDQLLQTKYMNEQFQDIRNSLGMITSFKSFLSQLGRARIYQLRRLFNRLPSAFITRCNLFTDFVSKLKAYYLNENTDLGSLIFLLRKLKNFDNGKDMFEVEVEICDALHSLIRDFTEGKNVHELSLEEDVEHSLAAASRRGSFFIRRRDSTSGTGKVAFGVSASFDRFAREKEELLEAIGRCRMFALNRLKQVGVDMIAQIKKLHEEVNNLTVKVASANMYIHNMSLDEFHNDISVNDVKSGLRKREIQHSYSGAHLDLQEIGGAINILRKRIDENISSQQLVHEGHCIVGAASCVLETNEMDDFVDMDRLEEAFHHKYKACHAICEARKLIKSSSKVKLGTCDITSMYSVHRNTVATISFLQSKSDNDGTIATLRQLANSIEPMLHMATFLKCDNMKSRHWESISSAVFEPCNMRLNISSGSHKDGVYVVDSSSALHSSFSHDENEDTEACIQGVSLRSMQINELLNRGLKNKIGVMKAITADACVEGMIESTLDAAYITYTEVNANLSRDWLEDKTVSDKLFFEIQRVTNSSEIMSVLLYCLKAVTVAEHTAVDMHIDIFEDRINSMKSQLSNVMSFVTNIFDIQDQWLSLFHFVKYSYQGDLDRDTERVFQTCTEDLKKIEMLIQTSPGYSMHSACRLATEHGLNLLSTINLLDEVSQSVHASTQSMLDACPRLALLPYHRTKKLIKAWLVSPFQNITFITGCLREMFEGVGMLDIVDEPIKRQQACHGFVSTDHNENIIFGETVSLNIPLDEFISKFEFQLRLVLSRSCDMIIVNYIQGLKDRTGEMSSAGVIDCIRDVFKLRMSHVLSKDDSVCIDDKPNQSIVLVNMSTFAENVWLCLGFSIGSIHIARPDLSTTRPVLSKRWRSLLTELIEDCRENICSLQQTLLLGMENENTKLLYSTLFHLEISHVNTLEELLLCPCLDSTIELWAGKYQLRFLYDKSERYQNSPFEVTLGCVSVPYGLEYQGSSVCVVTSHRAETALQKVVDSAYMLKGTVFISHDNDDKSVEAVGEYAVSCRELACALGRVYTTLSSVCNDNSIKLFLSRLLYLNAIGCIDFTALDHDSLHVMLNAMNNMWSAMERKDDFFMVGTLKYPLKTRHSANALHMSRRKSNMVGLRDNLSARGNDASGLVIIGIASETLYTDVTVLDYLTKSSFNIVALEHNRPVDDMGMLLSMDGFKYGVLLQMIFQEVIKRIHEKFFLGDGAVFLSSSIVVKAVVKQCVESLILGKVSLQRLLDVISDRDILQLEMECLYSATLNHVILLGRCSKEDLVDINREVRSIMQEHVDFIMGENCRFQLAQNSKISSLNVPSSVRDIIGRTMESLGLMPGSMFVEQASTLWSILTGSCPVVILSGPSGCGKSSVRNCVIESIRREGFSSNSQFANMMALHHWRAAIVLGRAVVKWLNSRRNSTRRTAGGLKILKSMLEGSRVKTSIVHHTSLTMDSLIGSFDDNGKWKDGTLLRRIRQTDDIVEKEEHSKDSKRTFQVIILQGPIGSHIEQLFSNPHYFSHMDRNKKSRCRISFPSGECGTLDSTVSVVMESSDLSQTSPTTLMHTAHVHCDVTPNHCSKRLLSVWTKSLGVWIRQFPSWSDSYMDLCNILLRTGFVKEMLNCDMTPNEMNVVTSLSRTSTFLRYLEELIHECHKLALAESSWNPETISTEAVVEDTLSINSDSMLHLSQDHKVNLFPTLNVKEKERLYQRVRLSIAYSAIWGFGGGVNGTSRRSFFDVLAKQSIETYLGSSVVFIHELSLFELSLCLKDCCFMNALTLKKCKISKTPVIPNEPKGAHALDASTSQENSTGVRAEYLNCEHSIAQLYLHTSSSEAAKCAFKILLKSGSNVILTGPAGAGKSRIARSVISHMGRNCPSPSSMRNDILERLVDIIGNGVVPDGISAVLNVLRRVLKELRSINTNHNDDSPEVKIARDVNAIIEEHSSSRYCRDHFDCGTVFTCETSLKSFTGASDFRRWLLREFRSESIGILEPPRYTYAMIFIDDLHLCDVSSDEISNLNENARVITNKLEGLIRGLVDGALSFALSRDISAEATLDEKVEMPLHRNAPPLLHKEFLSDPVHSTSLENDFHMSQLGIIAAATGDIKDLYLSSKLSRLLPYFGVVGIPYSNADELKNGFVFGTMTTLNEISKVAAVENGLLKYVSELVSDTLEVVNSVTRNENQYSALEKSIIPQIKPSVEVIRRFCVPMSLLKERIATPHDLLSLWVHEWVRVFLDPLPSGSLKSRMSGTWKNKLNRIDLKLWRIDADDIQVLMDRVDDTSSSVWLNKKLFTSSDDHPGAIGYGPVSFDDEAFDDWCNITSSAVEIETSDCKPKFSLEQLIPLKRFHAPLLTLYPQAMANVLRIMRILSTLDSNVALMSCVGASIRAGLQLATSLCTSELYSYDCKDRPVPVSGTPSAKTIISYDFRRYLKVAVLAAAGYEMHDEGTNFGNSPSRHISCVCKDPKKVCLSIHSAQLLSVEERSVLVTLMDLKDPCVVFNTSELEGLIHAMRTSVVRNGTVSYKQEDTKSAADNSKSAELSACDGQATNNHDNDAIGKKEETDVICDNPNVSQMDLATKRDSIYKFDVHGYTYQWIKRRLAQLVKTNLRICFCVDMPRAMEHYKPSSSERMLDLADKFDARLDEINIKAGARGVSMGTLGAANRAKKRFTLLSKAALSKQASDNLRESQSGSVYSSEGAENGRVDSSFTSISHKFGPAHRNVFNCPILKRLISNEFHIIWWDINRKEATTGVSRATLCTELRSPMGLWTPSMNLYLPFKLRTVDSTTSSLRVGVDISVRRDNCVPLLSDLPNLGIFGSFSCGGNIFTQHCAASTRPRSVLGIRSSLIAKTEKLVNRPSSTSFLHDVHSCVMGMVAEGRELLSCVMSVPLPLDSLHLTQPVLCIDPERQTLIASNIVKSALDSGAKMLLTRKKMLTEALLLEKDATVVLNSLSPILGLLESTQLDIMKAIRQLSNVLKTLSDNISSLESNSSKSEHFISQTETLLMQKEDEYSSHAYLYHRYKAYENILQNCRSQVKSIQAREWIEFAKAFSGKNIPKAFLMTMNGILMLANSIPAEMDFRKKFDDESHVVKLALSSLRSMEFVNTISQFNPASFSTLEIRHLSSINALLRNEIEGVDMSSDESRIGSIENASVMPGTLQQSSVSDVAISTQMKLALYLRRMQELYALNSECTSLKQKSIEKSMELNSKAQNVIASRKSEVKVFQAEYEKNEEELRHLDAELMRTKEKLLKVSSLLHDGAGKYVTAIHENMLYLENEIEQIDKILSHIVPDCCIAATVLVRTGWLPEHLRAETVDFLRDLVRREHHVIPSDDPFVIGCMLDRLQVRNWTRYSQGNMLRDVPSINAMSLLCLNPGYTFIIDPDGIAEFAIVSSMTEEYSCYHTTGAHFSIEELENEIRKYNAGEDSGFAIIVYDVQAGASSDLVAFLCANVESKGHNHDSEADESHLNNIDDICDLCCTLDPLYDTTSSCTGLIFRNRVRVVVISAEPPTLDSAGVGRPLPPACFKNMITVHWASSTLRSFYVESKPLHAAMNKVPASSCLMECVFADAIFEKIAPNHLSKLSLLNSRIIDYTFDLYIAESSAFTSVLSWKKKVDRKEECRDIPNRSQYISHPVIDLSFLESEECCKVLLEARSRRVHMTNAICNAKKLERDSLMYQSVVYDMCSMAVEYIRFCDAVIAPQNLPPYAMNAVTVGVRCIKPFLHSIRSKSCMKGLPQSMQELQKSIRSIKNIQQRFRQRHTPGNASNTNVDQSSILVTESFAGPKALSIACNNPTEQLEATPLRTSSKSPRRKRSSATRKSFSRSNSRRKSSISKKRKSQSTIMQTLKSLKVNEFMHITTDERDGLMNDLSVMFQPLREQLLSAVVNYVATAVSPGLEWMAEMCLVLCSWSQAAPIPLDEFRAMLHLFNGGIEKLPLFSVSYAERTSVQRPATSYEDDRMKTTVIKHQKLESPSFTNMDLTPRTESFWVNSNDVKKLIPRKRHKSAINIENAAQNVGGWLCRGNGNLDGVWLNRRSQRWRIGYISPIPQYNQSITGAHMVAAPVLRWDPVFCDSIGCDIVAKNPLFQPIPHAEDDFLVEWMRIVGMKSHHDFCSTSKMARGEMKFANTVMSVVDATKIHGNETDSSQSTSRTRGSRLKSYNAAANMRKSIRSRSIRRQSVQIKSGVTCNEAPTEHATPDLDSNDSVVGNSDNMAIDERMALFSAALRKPTEYRIKPEGLHTKFASLSKPDATTKDTKSSGSYYVESKSLNNLLKSPDSILNLKVLEKHPSLSPIFYGVSIGIAQYLEEFITWRDFLKDLCHRKLSGLHDEDIVAITAQLIPPQLDATNCDSDLGLWANGKELSVIQTLILVAVVEPSAFAAVVHVFLRLCDSYLRKGNVIMKHRDEFWESEEDSEGSVSETDEISDDGSCYADFDAILEESEDSENSGDDSCATEEDTSESDGGDSVRLDAEDKDRFQDGLFDLNCWTRLKRIAAGTEVGRRVRCSRKRTRSRLTCRDFENWESVLLKHLNKWHSPVSNKFEITKSLQQCLDGSGPLFLATDRPDERVASLTHRTREYASYYSTGNARIAVVDPRVRFRNTFDSISSVNSTKETLSLAASAPVTLSEMTSFKRTTAVEKVPLNTAAGNSILEAVFYRTPYTLSDTVPTLNLPPTADRQRSSVSSSGRLRPSFVVSAEWSFPGSKLKHIDSKDRVAYGMGPALYLGLHDTRWLPKCTVADIIGCQRRGSFNRSLTSYILSDTRGIEFVVSRCSAEGVLCEELDSVLLFVMTSLRRVSRTKLIRGVRERIRYSPKLDIRCTSAVLVIWRMTLYLDCKYRVRRGLPGCWSKCLEPVSLWQLARIILKVSDLLSSDMWNELTSSLELNTFNCADVVSRIHSNRTFVRAVHILAESFCRILYSSNNSTTSNGRSENNSRNAGRSRLSVVLRQDSGLFSSTGNLLSRFADYKSRLNFSSGVSNNQTGNSSSVPYDISPGTPLKYEQSIPRPPSKEKPSIVRKRKKEQLRREAAKSANTTLLSFDSLSSASLQALGPSRRYYVPEEYRKRLCSTLAEYLSNIIARHVIYKKLSEQKNCSDMRTDVTQKLVDITESAAPIGSRNEEDLGGVRKEFEDFGDQWPAIHRPDCDMIVGPLSTADTMELLIQWTLRDMVYGGDTKNARRSVHMKLSTIQKIRKSLVRKAKFSTNVSSDAKS